MKKSVLISGAGGLLGHGLSAKLVERGARVHIITHSGAGNDLAGVVPISIDFASSWSEAALPSNVDTIIHLAQSEKFRDFPDSALDVFKVNIESTARLLDYAKRIGVRQFIYASSGGIYGNGVQAFDENAPIIPPGQLGYYLGSKACGEILVHSYASVLQVVVIRPFFIYGPGQNRGMLIPRLMDHVALGKPISLQGKNGIRINPIHVEDASAAVASTLDLEECATFNIAGPEVLSIRDICETFARYLGKPPVFEQASGDPHDLIADISSMEERLVAPRRRLSDCLDDIRDTTNP